MSGESKGVTSCPENVKEKSWTENGLSIIDFSFHFHDNFVLFVRHMERSIVKKMIDN